MVFDIFCASYKFISIGPKRSFETNISKKVYVPGKQKFQPISSPFIKNAKPLGTIF